MTNTIVVFGIGVLLLFSCGPRCSKCEFDKAASFTGKVNLSQGVDVKDKTTVATGISSVDMLAKDSSKKMVIHFQNFYLNANGSHAIIKNFSISIGLSGSKNDRKNVHINHSLRYWVRSDSPIRVSVKKNGQWFSNVHENVKSGENITLLFEDVIPCDSVGMRHYPFKITLPPSSIGTFQLESWTAEIK